jgi:hypothetical protein
MLAIRDVDLTVNNIKLLGSVMEMQESFPLLCCGPKELLLITANNIKLFPSKFAIFLSDFNKNLEFLDKC